MTNLPLEDLTKEELGAQYGVSTSQTKSQMIAEINAATPTASSQPLEDEIDPAVQRAMEFRNS